MTRDRDTFDMFSPRERGRFADNESERVRGNDDVRSDLIDLKLVLHHETPARGVNPGAILVSNDGNDLRAQWIPKSLCEFQLLDSHITGKRKDGSPAKYQAVTVTLSEKIAKDKGLV